MYSIHEPSDKDHERYEEKGVLCDQPQDEQPMLPMHEFFSLIKRRAFAGSCCAGVAALYFVVSWDHNLITWLPSSFARAGEITEVKKQVDEVRSDVKPLQSDVADMYSLLLSRDIRDVWHEFCSAKDPSNKRSKEDQLERLQSTYEARKGSRYVLLPCRDL